MKCRNCGANLNADDNYCPLCLQKVDNKGFVEYKVEVKKQKKKRNIIIVIGSTLLFIILSLMVVNLFLYILIKFLMAMSGKTI